MRQRTFAHTTTYIHISYTFLRKQSVSEYLDAGEHFNLKSKSYRLI